MERQEPGLSTVDALRILHSDLEEEVKRYISEQRSKTSKHQLRTSFLHHGNLESVYPWTSVCVLLVCALLLLVSFSVQEHYHYWLAIESLIILLVIILTLYLLVLDDKLKKNEHVVKIRRVLKKLEECTQDGVWAISDFLPLHCPLSPCVSLQWTARDGHIVNLPCAFLVEGDIIYLRPGQVILTDCVQLGGSEENSYKAGDKYNPSLGHDPPDHTFSGPKARTPWKPIPFVVKETPFVKNLQDILRNSHIRPSSVLNNERYQTYNVWVERRLLVFIFAIVLLTNVLRFMFLQKHLGHWAEVCLSLQAQAVLPLTAIVYPLLWKLVNMYGTARLVSLFHKSRELQLKQSSGFESSSTLDGAAYLIQDMTDICRRMREILCGGSDTLPRTSNLLHSLGNVTSFCCVDKKGVLSWPNPTVEKVFFMTSSPPDNSRGSLFESEHSSQSMSTASDDDGNEDTEKVFFESKREPSQQLRENDFGRTHFQVLDVTQDTQNHHALNFDDPSWKRYVNSLKPLGLNILLNTCNVCTTEKYTQFADHVTCASHKHEVSIPVVNRRCFCELAHEIGFNENATNIFSNQHSLGLYRHLAAEHVARDMMKAKRFIKYQMPMPHMFSVIVRENNSGMYQLFSQGTADLLLDTCSEFWNGSDLCPLTAFERKKILDFYHRTSISSYCTAFSYRPMARTLTDDISDAYIEIPAEAYDLFPSLRSPTPSKSWDTQSLESWLRATNHDYCHSSLDSLIMDNNTAAIRDVPGCFREQCNQIFIGMISMQYQAKQDIVDLIENLESACIRFVHFSKENELRSRVFSEKMGLEAGWNCHISLLGEHADEGVDVSPSQPDLSQSGSSNRVSRYSSRNSTDSGALNKASRDVVLTKIKASQDSVRGRRLSAPGAISLDTTLVKFETTPSPQMESSTRTSQENCSILETSNQDSLTDASCDKSKAKIARQLFKDSNATGPEDSSNTEQLQESLLNQTETFSQDTMHECPDAESNGGDIPVTQALLQGAQSGMSMDSLPASSFVTENTDSVTGALGLANRAKLPKGIENIRPHLENVDNVPLLVSLFTDCKPHTTKEMLSILQEYGEVVCCLGSSCNIHNTSILLQADCSLSVEPLYTQICKKQAPSTPQSAKDKLSPMELNAMLHSLPCSLSFTRNDNIAIIRLIALARHHCQQMRHMFLFFLMCQLTVSLVHVIGGVALLPPALAAHQTLWLVIVVVPLLSLTVMGSPLDLQIVKMAQGKNVSHLSYWTVLDFLKYYLIRYLPSIFVCLLCHSLTLTSFCMKATQPSTEDSNSTTSSCHFLFGNVQYSEAGHWNGWYSEYHHGLVISQNILAFQLVLYFACGSMSFVYRLKQLWEEPPFTNRIWCLVVPLLITVQVLYFALDVTVSNRNNPVSFSLHDVPIATWTLALAWIIVLVPLHELTKRHEAKTWQRYQKRARLDFGTKLGMNSPF